MQNQKFKPPVTLSLLILLILPCLRITRLYGQTWENITKDLWKNIGQDTAYVDDVLNRKTGALAVMPRGGNLILVPNGRHTVYHSRDQGASWQPVENSETAGRSYGGFSIDVDPKQSRYTIFKIVPKKHLPARGLQVLKDSRTRSIGKPQASHDGWTWGATAWADDPKVILGKEHHAWVALWLSTDGGGSWKRLAFESRNPGVLNAQTFLAGNDDGIYRSVDQGQCWNKVADYVVTGKIPVRYGKRVYWTTREGVIASRDQGKNWTIQGAPLPGALWGPYFGRKRKQMLVVTDQGLFVTRNGGKMWKKAADFFAPPYSNRDGQCDIVHPTNSYGWDDKRNILYAAGLGGDAYRLQIGKRKHER